jgi:magnesium chelatase family protein
MTVARVLSVALFGVQGHLVEIEAYLGSELPGLTMIGLPDAALQEARDRIRAAIVNSGEAWPNRRIVVSLSPASEPKRGSSFDLALAAAVLLAARAVPTAAIAGRVLLGELGLDGRVRPIPGVLPAVLAATAAGVSRVVVPSANAAEAALVPGVEVVGVSSLRAMVALLRGTPMLDEPEERPVGTEVASPLRRVPAPDLADVLGQLVARRAVEIAAAGGHHMFLHGPPGAGKTMLAERLPGLLPQLDQDAALEVTAIHSVAGLLPAGGPLITRPPFAGPHHTASVAAIVGGGSGLARPGAASLAHPRV